MPGSLPCPSEDPALPAARRQTLNRQTSGTQQLEHAIAALRRVWIGGPEMPRDIAMAVDTLRHLQPQAASTHEAAVVLETAIASLRHLPHDLQERRETVAGIGK